MATRPSTRSTDDVIVEGGQEGAMDRFTIPTKYWHQLDDGRVQCDVCPRACKLRDGQRGVCFVRARQVIDDVDGVVLTTYGRSSGFCVDPIEKKPLNHFLPGSSVFSFGTAGCNLACRFCQNWDISKSKAIDTLADQASPETIARTAHELGMPERGVHVQRPDDLPRVRDRCRRGMSRARDQGRGGDRRIHLPRASTRLLPAPRCRQRRPQGVHRGFLPAHGRCRSGRRAGDPRVPGTRPTSGSNSRRC